MGWIGRCSVALALVGCPREPAAVRVDDPALWDRDLRLEVAQPAGRTVHWVLPGKRDLSLLEFGSPADPRNYGEGSGQPEIDALLERWPFLAGVPVALRNRTADGRRWLDTRVDVPWGGPLVEVVGEVRVVMYDRWVRDRGLPRGTTADEAELHARFTDPGGSVYRVTLREVVEVPFPGWDTGGGVLVDQPLFGNTGTGTPLMPEVHAWGAVWGLADVTVDGQVIGTRMLTSIATHETAHDDAGRLVQTLELPLALQDTIVGHPYQTRLVVLPIRFGAEGPVYTPLQTAHVLPGGLIQDFIHVVFEEPSVLDGPPFPRRPAGQASTAR